VLINGEVLDEPYEKTLATGTVRRSNSARTSISSSGQPHHALGRSRVGKAGVTVLLAKPSYENYYSHRVAGRAGGAGHLAVDGSFSPPEKVIRRRLTELARTVSTSANESDLARLAAARGVAGFSPQSSERGFARLGQRTMDREEITQLA